MNCGWGVRSENSDGYERIFILAMEQVPAWTLRGFRYVSLIQGNLVLALGKGLHHEDHEDHKGFCGLRGLRGAIHISLVSS